MVSFGLAVYRFKNNRPLKNGNGQEDVRPPRPDGPLIWLHGADHAAQLALLVPARRLMDEDRVHVLITGPQPELCPKGALWHMPPGDGKAAVQDFLAYWQPACIIFAGGEVRPNMIYYAHLAHIPMAMLAADVPYFMGRQTRWSWGLMKQSLLKMQEIFALHLAAAQAFRKAGMTKDIFITGPCERPVLALPYSEAEKNNFTQMIAARPVWLAVDVPLAEEEMILAAHRQARRMLHRLLLIMIPQQAERALPLAQHLGKNQDWHVALHQNEDELTSESDIFIASPEDYGLWYCLASVTFCGGSLAGEGCLRNPLEAASLGSAVLHGFRSGGWQGEFQRLSMAGGTRLVQSDSELPDALLELLAPDRAAQLAYAGWNVISEGAEVTERSLALIRRLMEGH